MIGRILLRRGWLLVLPAAIVATASVAASPTGTAEVRAARTRALSELEALGGAMPANFDLLPTDPCAGPWDVVRPDGSTALKITVLRYRSLPVMHVSGEALGSVNGIAVRQDPHSVALTKGSMTIILRCAANRAVMELLTGAVEVRRRQVFDARPGLPEPPIGKTPADGRAPTTRASSHPPGVGIEAGNLVYTGSDGVTHVLIDTGGFEEAVISPDTRLIAAIHRQRHTAEETGQTSLWVYDLTNGRANPLLLPKPDTDPQQTLASFQNPRFSLDGGFVYVDADAWVTSSAVHQINVRTGAERFVIDGWTRGVIRDGPYRGYLLVQRHQYRKPPQSGSYNPVYVVRPDAKQAFPVPGSDVDDGDRSLTVWLRTNGWTAS